MCRQPDYILEGEGFLQTFADYAIHYGDVALLIVDQQAEQLGYKEKVIHALDEMGLRMITSTLSNHWPSIEIVKNFWSELETEHEPNLLISLGGSHVIHFAKALSIMAPYKGQVRDLFTGKGNIGLALPHLTIPLESFPSYKSSLAISDTVTIYDQEEEQIQFSHGELVPKMVGYATVSNEKGIRNVS